MRNKAIPHAFPLAECTAWILFVDDLPFSCHRTGNGAAMEMRKQRLDGRAKDHRWSWLPCRIIPDAECLEKIKQPIK